ncbi:chloride channel protein, CIC family [Kaistia soli DSM 19436]|uniref:Chloride channel protein, CIC family n=1 Tax=Kaistia soli DSM 19436 TaxID=1122133 RepID=A0A1M5FSZ8_9HYPH|nr:chloride channel protein [Kaistia soli]SHF94321.1 chloride channel protein, CIC family [Kaistia soli DSM 19436]
MPPPAPPERPLARVRALFRSSEPSLLLLAAIIGALAGVIVVTISLLTEALHVLLFGIDPGSQLSAAASIEPWQVAVPLAGGALLGLVVFLFRKRRRLIVDPIEANALHGGQMSLFDSLRVGLESVISNGFGASVGLEAGYTQVASGFASAIGTRLGLRRADLRLVVGCGSAGAIAAAFGGPLTGAFYGFELIIGVYSVANVAPVLIAALTGYLVARGLGLDAHVITVPSDFHIEAANYPPFLLLGLLLGLLAIGIMRLITLVELGFQKSGIPRFFRPAIGGAAVGLLALITPQALSGGHGALYLNLATTPAIGTLLLVILVKIAATSTSVGSGFRGGLFFASLFLGVLVGRLYGASLELAFPQLDLDPTVTAIVGMSALAVGIIGGPLTMTFLALEVTGDLQLTGIVLAASVLSTTMVRQFFGYSFSTWRLHLRGETIRGAQDIGWLRDLTVGRMMRTDVRPILASMRLDAFRSLYPLGSAQRVVATDNAGAYAGIVLVSDAHASAEPGEHSVAKLCRYPDRMLLPDMTAREAAATFDAAESEELVVVDDTDHRQVIGLLTEAHLLRRYAEELDKARRSLSGES